MTGDVISDHDLEHLKELFLKTGDGSDDILCVIFWSIRYFTHLQPHEVEKKKFPVFLVFQTPCVIACCRVKLAFYFMFEDPPIVCF